MSVARVRIDHLLVQRGLAASRDRARRLIMSGEVRIADRRIDKPGTLVPADAAVVVEGADIPYVSRGGLKLEAALDHWHIDVHGVTAADIGASTGGFTDCLLQRGAAHVHAIDVGYGQLAWRLRQDPRVTVLERTNIRTVQLEQVGAPVDLVVVDVSFISLRLVLPVAVTLLRPGGTLLPLVKPQFEVGKGQVGKGGVVRDATLHDAVVATVRDCGTALGLTYHGVCPSPVPGPKGNREFFLYFTTGG
jgi:23S rRNA (cytidine1920-2'-O)/16S rRNA (cytidine1409-2'-O)-methyltransferase